MIIDNYNIYSPFIQQFITIAIIHFFAVISPGPDFSIVIKQSIVNGRKHAIITSLGIACGIMIHMFYCIIGFAVIISSNLIVFNIIKIIGAIYLLYIGVKTLFIKKDNYVDNENNNNIQNNNHFYKSSFIQGFITNVFNPKATLFFLSLFSLFIKVDTPMIFQLFYAVWMTLVTGLWFCLVSMIFTNKISKIFISKYAVLFDKIMGMLLVFISIKLVLS